MLTISLRASKASMSPLLAAAQASGGVRALRMAASSFGHNTKIFKLSESGSRFEMFTAHVSWPKSAKTETTDRALKLRAP